MQNIIVDKKIIGPIIFIIFTVSFLYSVISKTPKVLILHSYNADYIWTYLLDKNLALGLKKRQNIRVKTFYMNSKFVYNRATELSSLKIIQQYDPDIILAFDDNAQTFLSKYYLDSDIKIVFAGVNSDVEKYNYIGNQNITGVFERKPFSGIKFVLQELNKHYKTPNNNNIALLVDGSNSNKKDSEFLKDKQWDNFNFKTYVVSSFAQWKKFILSMPNRDIDYLLLSGYRKLTTVKINGIQEYADYADVVSWTKDNTKIPIMALNVFSAKDGFALAIGSSAYEQVYTALDMIDKIIESNIKPYTIPYKYPEFYSISINKTALSESQYSIPKFLEAFAGSSHNIYE